MTTGIMAVLSFLHTYVKMLVSRVVSFCNEPLAFA